MRKELIELIEFRSFLLENIAIHERFCVPFKHINAKIYCDNNCFIGNSNKTNIDYLEFTSMIYSDNPKDKEAASFWRLVFLDLLIEELN